MKDRYYKAYVDLNGKLAVFDDMPYGSIGAASFTEVQIRDIVANAATPVMLRVVRSFKLVTSIETEIV